MLYRKLTILKETFVMFKFLYYQFTHIIKIVKNIGKLRNYIK